MSSYNDHDSRIRIPGWMMILAFVGAGFFFFRGHGISGLDQLSVYKKNAAEQEFISYRQASAFPTPSSLVGSSEVPTSENPFDVARRVIAEVPTAPIPTAAVPIVVATPQTPRESIRNLRIASWALDGFNPSKLANPIARRNIVRVLRQFDVVALQQIASLERDLIPRLADAANEAGRNYEYLIGEQVGPDDHPEQLAFIFDAKRVQVDRTQTYTLADPDNQISYNPLVAWFRAVGPRIDEAWTFSLVNVRVDLGRAPDEVALLGGIMSAVRLDGRGEDDVIMAGLMQADDEYLLPSIAGDEIRAAVRSVPTDIFGRHQTCNVLMDAKRTSEYVGRGGAFDFLRVYNLSAAEAETITSHLPVFAEFIAVEGGKL